MTTLGAHLLGRVAPADDSHIAAHPFLSVAKVSGVEVNIARPTLDVYDQGDTPKCVAFSTSKVINHFNRYAFDAAWLYDRCKEFDGMPNEDGTNARAACEVLRNWGHWRKINGKGVKGGPSMKHGIASNTWATTVDGIRAVFAAAKPQPVLIGIPWLNAWFNPEHHADGSYYMQPSARAGSAVGGHEIGIWACSDKRQAFGLSNTWGHAWPSLVYLPYNTMDWLFGQGADACVIQDLATR